MSSYLSLAAIENAELLAQHIQPIIDSVISGNYSLSRVLPQIYSVNRDPIKSHVMTLVSIFPNCENTEKMALLNLFALVAKDNPTLLEPSIHQLSDGLTSQATALATLQVTFGKLYTYIFFFENIHISFFLGLFKYGNDKTSAFGRSYQYYQKNC